LLDEPHAGLDQDGRDIVDQLVRDATQAGATVIVASHEIERAKAMAPRSVTVAGGVVVADSAAREVAQDTPRGVANVG
jgi:energy-coupling factor transporter ATP-binding protein EcfA2